MNLTEHTMMDHESDEKISQHRFDYVCANCGRMSRHSMTLLEPGRWFACKYCKVAFGVVNNKITRLTLRSPALDSPRYMG